ncbi:MAG: peptidylprolyl isomerase [Muribaculaceae bacterium]|nr:peptidylprolyl isomerase [Muribaculaceae bacterium]
MKNMLITAGLTAIAFAVVAKESVIMTVNGVDIPTSEFEYLYHKNSRQQAEPQPIADYVEMFKLYKMKVEDAKACGIDTTSSFREEMAQYRRELALPYVTDSAFLESLVNEACSRVGEDVEAYHIMVSKGVSRIQNIRNKQLLDSLRNLVVAGEDFGELAMKYSADKSAVNNKGYLGYIHAGKFPYDFETAVYSTPEGVVSGIVESPVGYHIVKSGSRRPARGKVKVSHIMKLVSRGASEEEIEKSKSEIDSIYQIVTSDPSRFVALAKELSDDKGSARTGGMLPAFGTGEMVPEFETVAYALRPGEISKPVRSVYGWHIIRKSEDLPLPTCSQIRPEVMRAISNPRDDRYWHIKEREDAKLMSKHGAKIDRRIVGELCDSISDLGLDKVKSIYSGSHLSDRVIAEIGNSKVTVAELMAYLDDNKRLLSTPDAVTREADSFLSSKLFSAEEDWLYENESDYRNLLNEYHDGSLLYEVSLEKVWNRAARDTVGLDNYFRDHYQDYKWEMPKAKGYLIQAVSDSVADSIRERLKDVSDEEVVPVVRKEFPNEAKIEKVLASEGINPMVDNLMFGAPAVVPTASKFKVYFFHSGRILDAPEVVDDVKSQVIADYQMKLETEWTEHLKRSYPVKINKKELKKVK